MTAPSTPLLFDTDVLIDYLRGRTEATDYIDNLSAPLFVSVILVTLNKKHFPMVAAIIAPY
jgi:predicted nucleic acid-binding protein